MNKRPLESNGDDGAAKKLKSSATSSMGAGTTLSQEEVKLRQEEVRRKFAMFQSKASLGIKPQAATSTQPVHASSSSQMPSSQISAMARQVAEAKAKKKAALAPQGPINPYVASSQTSKKRTPEESAPQGSGLSMAAHPLLLDTTTTTTPTPQSKKDRYKPLQPKFASIKANIRNTPTPTLQPKIPASPAPEIKANPYATSRDTESGSFEGAAPKERGSRQLKFNQKGKYVQIATQMRHDAALEALKQRIAESARKAGLDSEFETVERAIRRGAPPAAEWWDVAFLPNDNYDDLSGDLSNAKIRSGDIISLYIQHPIKIPAPGEKEKIALKPLMLTKKEQKKMRKQRRQQELQDHRDRVKMGLIPPDAPKVRLANLMKVLTNDAIQDPTRVEARVRREVAMRRHNHEKMNNERKLTDEQRREKKEIKKVDEEKKGLVGAIFRVNTLANGQHRFKIKKNAAQYNLTGIVITHPQFSMIYAEGAVSLMKKYKRLLQERIRWTEEAQPRDGDEDEEAGGAGMDEMELSKNDVAKNTAPVPDSKAVEEGEFGTSSLDDNRCDLIWEGQLRERSFKGRLRWVKCPTDGSAKEALGEKMAGFWDLTKNWKADEIELF